MNILINGSNMTIGGGVQVTDSICRELYKFPQHQFVVVLTTALKQCASVIKKYPNVKVILYQLPLNKKNLFYKLKLALSGRDSILDNLVKEKNIDCVLTIFGPSGWIPKCLHISGFARAQIVLNDSPYRTKLSILQKLKFDFMRSRNRILFKNSSKIFYTENRFISQRLQKVFPNSTIYTVTNNYNQIFDSPALWDRNIQLNTFNGITLLTIAANYPHKNLSIIIPTIHYLKKEYPSLRFRFVLTINEKEFVTTTNEERKHICFVGSININQCPPLYEQSNIMLLPSLLECFSASYAEAMRMKIPIITTDLGFAHSLCADAALYYNPLSPKALADSIYKLATSTQLQQELVTKGSKQLQQFDTFTKRAEKLIGIIEKEFQASKDSKFVPNQK